MKPGDRVRLRDGVLGWITKRDGWTVEDAYDGYGLIREAGGVAVSVPWGDIESEAPPIPAEPERVAGQAWRDAEGQTVVCAEPDAIPYITTTGDGAYLWRYWLDLAHPLTALYPVPDPDGYVDREDVEPDSPPIPPEPDAPAVLLTWGAPLHTETTMARTWDGRWAMPSDSLTYSWKHIPQLDTATATPLYPVPDPNDDEAVWEVADRAGRSGRVSTVRAVLRALRATHE